MSVKRGKKGGWDVEVRYFCPVRGYGLRKQRKNFKGTRQEAKDLEQVLLTELMHPPNTAGSLTVKARVEEHIPSHLTFGMAADMYIDNCKVRGKAYSYLSSVRMIKKQFDTIPLDRSENVEFITAFKKWRNGLTCEGTAINSYTKRVKSIFNYLVKLELIDKSPIKPHLFPMYPKKRRERILSLKEEAVLLEVIKRFYPFIYPIVRYTSIIPARWASELLYATLKDNYRHEDRLIYIENSKAQIPIYKPIPPEMYNYFDNIKDRQKYIFFEGQKRPNINRVRKLFRAACIRAGLGEDVVLYTLRHAAITKLVNKGNNQHIIAAVCGWTSPNQLDTYYHLSKMEASKRLIIC